MNPNEKRQKAENDGHKAVVLLEIDGKEENGRLFDYVVEEDYSFICRNEGERAVSEYRKHSVAGVRWL